MLRELFPNSILSANDQTVHVSCEEVCHSHVGWGIVELICCLFLGYLYYGLHVIEHVTSKKDFAVSYQESEAEDSMAIMSWSKLKQWNENHDTVLEINKQKVKPR